MSKTKSNKSIDDSGVASQNPDNNSFEHSIAELETIVNQMESGQLPLEQSLNAYKRGNELLQVCQKSLLAVEQQVRVLTESNKLETLKSDDN